MRLYYVTELNGKFLVVNPHGTHHGSFTRRGDADVEAARLERNVSPTARRIAENVVKLNAIPVERRSQDWWVARDLLVEAVDHVKFPERAKALIDSAEPHVRFAQLV